MSHRPQWLKAEIPHIEPTPAVVPRSDTKLFRDTLPLFLLSGRLRDSIHFAILGALL
jgi:hypothetical protein